MNNPTVVLAAFKLGSKKSVNLPHDEGLITQLATELDKNFYRWDIDIEVKNGRMELMPVGVFISKKRKAASL